jgi:rod shape-determining protein MreB and related proteins
MIEIAAGEWPPLPPALVPMLEAVTRALRPDLAIDLGTATTRVAFVPSGPMLETSSVVSSETAETPALQEGVIANLEAATDLLRPLVAMAARSCVRRPRAIGCVPGSATQGDIDAYREAAAAAGLRDIAIVRETLAAAIGAGVEIASHHARMLVDIGEGITDLAVFQCGTIIRSATASGGCSELRSRASSILSSRAGASPPNDEIERLLAEYYDAPDDGHQVVLRSRSGARVALPYEELTEALAPVEDEIAQTILQMLRELPAAAGVEVIENDVCLTGGGALYRRLVERLESRTQLTMAVAPEPLRSVVRGARELAKGGRRSGLWDHARKTCICHP